jgi:hypothetical protein
MRYFKAALALTLMIAALGSCAGTQEREQAAAAGPEWVYAPDSVYPENRYVSAVGYGADREQADKNALGSLVAIFGQNVQGETQASYRYSEAVAGGLIDMREGSEIDSAVKTSFAMNTLIGAEIKDRWSDGTTHYAIAVMDRMKSGMLYSDLIESNRRVIQNLTDLPEADRYTFDAYAQYELAAAIADANTAFVNVLSVLSPASASAFRNELRQGDDYRLEARRVSQNIPVALTVDNDRNGRIRGAFAAVLSGEGFRTGGTGGARYTLDVAVSLSEAELSQNPNKFVRYHIDANLRDTQTGAVLIPFSLNGREGHASLSEAEVRAIRVAEEKIRESYGDALRSYLTHLSSQGN